MNELGVSLQLVQNPGISGADFIFRKPLVFQCVGNIFKIVQLPLGFPNMGHQENDYFQNSISHRRSFPKFNYYYGNLSPKSKVRKKFL